MPDNKAQLEEFLLFIKERRSDESNFNELYSRLEELIQSVSSNGNENADFLNQLKEAKEKQAETYKQVKENSGTAWPEYEKFITQLEKSTTAVVKE